MICLNIHNRADVDNDDGKDPTIDMMLEMNKFISYLDSTRGSWKIYIVEKS